MAGLSCALTFLFIMSFAMMSTAADKYERFFSCKDLKTMYPSYESGIYVILLPSGEHEVYCEMGINGGGYTFIPPSLVSKLTSSDVKYLTKNQDDVLLRIARPNGTQPYTVLTPVIKGGKFAILLSSYSGGRDPVNAHLGPYIFLSTLPGRKEVNGTMAFNSNGVTISYPAPHVTFNYFAFFSNPAEKETSSYLKNDPTYEKGGVAVDWRKTAKRPNSCRRMPLGYFMLTELHYENGGTYTTSERWLQAVSPALGTAVGFR